MDKISVIVACYNGREYIEKCIESIINQTYFNLEIIIINDGSTDDSSQILSRYKAMDDRISIIEQSNRGLSETRNVGIRYATGEWIMFVDIDDWLSKDMVEETFRLDPTVDLYCCSYNRIFKNINVPRDLKLSGKYKAEIIMRRLVGLTDEELSDPTQADSLVTAWGKIYRRQKIIAAGLKFVDTASIGTEDALFNIQYLNYCRNVFVVNKPLYQYRKYNEKSLTNTYKADLMTKWENLYKLIRQEIEGKDHTFQTALNNRISLGFLGVSLNETLANISERQKYIRLKKIVNSQLYIAAFRNFDLHYMPLHWKIFYGLAKKKSVLGIYILATIIQIIQKRKNL